MKQLIKILLVAFLLTITTIGKASAKEVMVPKMYMYAFAASFTDSIVYMTNVMEVDSVWIQSKSKFLIGRDSYSRQFRDFLNEEKKMPNRTCVVFFNKSKSKAEKKYLKLRKLYTQSKNGQAQYDVRILNNDEFKFRPFDINAYIQAEQDRIQQAKDQAKLAAQQKKLAKQAKREARKARKEAKSERKNAQ